MNELNKANADDDLAKALSDLERRWRALGVPVNELLRPGLSPAAVSHTIGAAMETSAGAPGSTLQLSEAERWFSWRDGTRPGAHWVAAPMAKTLLSLQQALAERALMLSSARDQDYADPHDLWRHSWLPIGDSGVGVLLALDLEANTSGGVEVGESGSVVYVDWSDPQHYYRPVPTLLAATSIWAAALDTGVYSWDGQDWVYDFKALPRELLQTWLVG